MRTKKHIWLKFVKFCDCLWFDWIIGPYPEYRAQNARCRQILRMRKNRKKSQVTPNES